MIKLIASAALATLLGGVHLHAEAVKKEFQRPPYVGAYEPKGVDERGLWMEIDEIERSFRDLPIILRDERLVTYLNGVLCRTVGFDRCQSTRIYVLKDQSFNASMAPNGMMLIHTGLLARVHSEAELATILGHEFAHFELRHSLIGFRKLRSATDWLAWISLAGAASNTNTSSAQNGIIFGYYSNSREQERDADLLSAAYIRSSPYPLRASIVWKRLVEEDDAVREDRRLRKIKRIRPGPVDTHPTPLQRFAYLSELEAEEGATEGDDAARYYRDETERVLPDLFSGLVKGNEFAGTDYVIRSRGDALGWDGLLLSTRGELYRMRGNPRDLVTARQFFEKATQMEKAPPEAWRGLGLAALRTGDSLTGKAALKEYLVKEPNARDRDAIKILLEE